MNVSMEKKEAEALERVKELGIYSSTIEQFDRLGKISLSELPFGAFFWIEGEDLERVRKFEWEYNALVFIAIRNFISEGVMDSFLYVSDYPEEWADNRHLLEEGKAYAYVFNHDVSYYSDIGVIGIELTAAAGIGSSLKLPKCTGYSVTFANTTNANTAKMKILTATLKMILKSSLIVLTKRRINP